LNPADLAQMAGRYPAPAGSPQDIPGLEVSGTVVGCGAAVTTWHEGDRVFGIVGGGGLADTVVAHERHVARVPDALSDRDAAAAPEAFVTAHDAVFTRAGLRMGETLLVNGANGGVGTAAVQIARHEGLTVIGTASAGKKDFVESLGAVHVVSGPGVAHRVRAAAPAGVDGVFDLVGGEPLREVAPLVTDRSRLISGADRALVADLGGSAVVRARNAAVLEAVVALVGQGVLDPFVTRVFPFAEADRALRAVEEGHGQGKTVIEFGG
jgi:NADPH:quinone reductase-like Zn-dependent oxidoreductase